MPLGFVPVLLIIFALCAGCASWFDMRSLKDDALDEGFSSVVLLKLKITDNTGKVFAERRPVQAMFLSTRDNAPSISWLDTARNAQWLKRDDGTTYHEGLYVGQTRPTTYRLNDISLYMNGYNFGFVLKNRPLTFSVKPGQVLYLGTIHLTISAIRDEGKKVTYEYQYDVSNAEAAQRADVQAFQDAYPQLSRKFGDTVSAVLWQ